MKYNIAVLSGDGIGPEIVSESIKVLKTIENTIDIEFNFVYGEIGAIAIDEGGVPLPESTLAICKASDAILFGAIGDPKYDNNPELTIRPEQGLLSLRKELGLFCNIRPIETFEELIESSPLKREIVEGVDIHIYRELTGGIYFGDKGFDEATKSAFDVCSYSEGEIDRILDLAFKSAMQRDKHLTLVDKANVLETSRLWRKRAQLMSADYPDVKLDYLFVDNAAMQMILNPKQFDVIVTENMFGDIISDEASVIGGSIGILPSASIGEQTALFEPIHGSFPQAKGKNIANPIASILSTAMMLDHLGISHGAKLIRDAVKDSFKMNKMTCDLTKENVLTTSQLGDFLCSRIQISEEIFC